MVKFLYEISGVFLVVGLLSTSALAVNYCNDANCMGCWYMEEDGTTAEPDESGEGETLTVSVGDSIVRSADEKFGTYSRDLESDQTEWFYHADGGSSDIGGANQSISLVSWVKPESLGGTLGVIEKYESDGDERQYNMYLNSNGSVGCIVSSDGGVANRGIAVTAISKVSTATWAHVACVYNDTDVRIYIDGVVCSNGADCPATFSLGICSDCTAPLTVGASQSGDNNRFDGLLDDVAIFDDELSSAEVNAIMNYGLSGEDTPASGRRILILN